MNINMILATGLNGELGQTSSPDGLPWSKNKEDMKWFSSLTKGNVVVMGGNTFRQLQEIGFENGLPERLNIVLSRSAEMTTTMLGGYFKGQVRFLCVEGFKRLSTPYVKGMETFIIGGKSIYDQLHQYCDKVYLTRINQEFPDADVIMDLSWLEEFKLVDKLPLNDYSEVEVYERK